MTKEEAYEKATMQELGGNPNGTRQDVVYRAMEIYAKQQAIAFSNFKNDYQRIEAMNVRHNQIENFDGNIYSWIGSSDDKIWEAYKNGEQLKRYFEKQG